MSKGRDTRRNSCDSGGETKGRDTLNDAVRQMFRNGVVFWERYATHGNTHTDCGEQYTCKLTCIRAYRPVVGFQGFQQSCIVTSE